MNRVKDYMQFAVWFVGIGYIVTWPLTAHDGGVAGWHTSFFCGAQPVWPFGRMCAMPQPLHLSPGLHLIGILSSVCLMTRLLLRHMRRTPASANATNVVTAPPVRRPRKPSPPPRPMIKPRAQFGLRGTPQ